MISSMFKTINSIAIHLTFIVDRNFVHFILLLFDFNSISSILITISQLLSLYLSLFLDNSHAFHFKQIIHSILSFFIKVLIFFELDFSFLFKVMKQEF
jgi:hypothetical protein